MPPATFWGILALAAISVGLATGSPADACEAPAACEALVAETGTLALDLAQRAQRALLSPRKGGRREPSLPSIAFVKTHKTGGSTASDIMHRLAGKRNLSFISPNDDGVISWDMLARTLPPQHQFDMVACHQTFDEESVKAYLRTTPFIFTVLREPLARLDSGIRWSRRTHEDSGVEQDWGWRLEWMLHSPQKHTNEMSRDLGWYGVDIRRKLPNGFATFRNDHNSQAISEFISGVDKKMDLVFLTEHYDEGLVLLAHRLNLPLEDLAYVKAKVSEITVEEVKPPTAEQLKELNEAYLSVDRPLYEHFVARFWREWEEAGGHPKLGADLAALQARNDKLAKDCAAEPRDPELCPDAMLLDGGPLRSYVAVHGVYTNLLPPRTRSA